MPWKECHVVDERVRFVARLLDGEKMAGLCREFGISRKTGYKIFDRLRPRCRSIYGPQPPSVSVRQAAAGSRRSANRRAEAGVSVVGRAEDSGAAAAQVSRFYRCLRYRPASEWRFGRDSK